MSFLLLGGRRILQSSVLLSKATRPVLAIESFGFQRHWFSNSKKKDKKSSKKHTKSSKTIQAAEAASAPKKPETAEQHTEWVKFQQSIAIDGFDTGQTTQVVTRGRRKVKSKKKLSENQRKILERQRLTGTGGGEYPPLRFSEEETQRLLVEAYSKIPKRTGRRGGRNRKRQERRWQLVRDIHAKHKKNMIAYHYRRMAARGTKAKEVKEICTSSQDVIRRDREYQLSVYHQWAANMGLTRVPSLISSPAHSRT